jgi:hypothetical protein
VEGCLRNEAVSAVLLTSCARSRRPITIEVDGLGDHRVREEGASPLLFEPDVDWERFQKAHIIDDF